MTESAKEGVGRGWRCPNLLGKTIPIELKEYTEQEERVIERGPRGAES